MEKKPIKNSFQEALYKLFERLKKYLTDNNLSQCFVNKGFATN